MKINILPFEGFKVLDAFGPAEIFGKLEDWELNFCSPGGGVIKSAQLAEVMTADISEIDTEKIDWTKSSLFFGYKTSKKIFIQQK